MFGVDHERNHLQYDDNCRNEEARLEDGRQQIRFAGPQISQRSVLTGAQVIGPCQSVRNAESKS